MTMIRTAMRPRARNGWRVALGVFAFAVALAAPAHAQTPAQAPAPLSDAAKAMTTGTWEFSNADRDKRCTVTFRADPAAAGMRIEFDKGCVAHFPFIADVAGWTLADNDFLRLLDAQGKSILEFSAVETNIFEAPRPGEGILFIQASAAVGPPPKQADQVAGDWGLVRGSGKPICTLVLANTPAGDDLALSLKPGCNAFVTRFAPTVWQMDRGELMIKNARGQIWRFSEGDNGAWTRVPETAEPLSLVKP
ncbi:MAG TPA: AprI/Inh family metalloprotease inhibitor [Xanthobacteraceae bacterium]|nr:AprI/Inh family metalloprotease inhibitor [Xanthobacteraceae bacterium]